MVLTTPMAQVAHAEAYLTEDQAAKVLWPGVKLEAHWADLTTNEVKDIEKLSGERVLSPRVRVFWGPNREALVIDRVVGKHEFITYAVAISSNGTVAGVEIMDYRETFGAQVRQVEWRRQFVGKGTRDALKVEKDIRNISGATLSSVHVTNGVRRVLRMHEILKQKA